VTGYREKVLPVKDLGTSPSATQNKLNIAATDEKQK